MNESHEHAGSVDSTAIPGTGTRINGTSAGPQAKGNGQDTDASAFKGSGSAAAGTNPFADVGGSDQGDAADDWQDQLPTVARVQKDAYSLWDQSGTDALGRLKLADRPDYERRLDELSALFPAPKTVREKLDRTVDKAVREREREARGDGKSPDAITLMVEHIGQHGRLFCDPMRQAFLDYRDPATGMLVTRPVQHPDIRHTLTLIAYDATGRAPSDEALGTAVRTLEAQAKRSGETVPVFPRLGWHEDMLYIDRATPDGSVIQVDRSGFSIVGLATCPVRFLYDVAKGELPVPVSGGSVDQLWDILKLRSERDRKLTSGHLIGGLAPHGPYAGLAIYGLYGSSKTFTMWVLGELIDPSKVDPGMMSASEHDTLIMVQRVWSVRFDNLSQLSEEQSNTLCRLAQGGGFRTRLLYSSSDEVILQAERPVMVNGITEFISRPDLADRYRCVTLERIAPGDRKQRQELRDRFLAARPAILGALLDAVVSGLCRTNFTPPNNLPRMADHVVWVSRCELGLGFTTGAYLQAYNQNSTDAARAVVDASALAEQIEAFVTARAGLGWKDNEWKGTATALLKDLELHAGAAASRQQGWPKSANRLSALLKPLLPVLEEIGIEVILGDGARTNRSREIGLTCSPSLYPSPGDPGDSQKASSPSSPSSPERKTPGISGKTDDRSGADSIVKSDDPRRIVTSRTRKPQDVGDDPTEDRHLSGGASSPKRRAQPVETAMENRSYDDGDDDDDPFGPPLGGGKGGREKASPPPKVRRVYR